MAGDDGVKDAAISFDSYIIEETVVKTEEGESRADG
jgi:hypothetical protein